MEITDNPKLDLSSSDNEVCGMEQKNSKNIVNGGEKISVSDHINGLQYNTTMKPETFVIDMDTFSHSADKDINANSRFTLQRSLSKKGNQREKKMIPNGASANDRDSIVASSSPRGSNVPEKAMVMAIGANDHSVNPQVHHQITITTGNIIAAPESRWPIRRNSFKRSSSLWVIDPKRVLFFFATLSSMGTILLIYFTLSMSKYNGEDYALD